MVENVDTLRVGKILSCEIIKGSFALGGCGTEDRRFAKERHFIS